MYIFYKIKYVYINITIDSSEKKNCCLYRDIQILTFKNSLFSIVFAVEDCANVNETKWTKTATIVRFTIFIWEIPLKTMLLMIRNCSVIIQTSSETQQIEGNQQ